MRQTAALSGLRAGDEGSAGWGEDGGALDEAFGLAGERRQPPSFQDGWDDRAQLRLGEMTPDAGPRATPEREERPVRPVLEAVGDERVGLGELRRVTMQQQARGHH